MNQFSPSRLLPRLAVAAAMLLPSLAMAQGMIDTGRANDSSNRIGSGGRNSPGMGSSYYSNNIINNGNRVVTGNVTLGREFRDNVGYGDPYSFRGNMPSANLDTFYRNTVGVPQAYTREGTPNVSTPYYGGARTVEPPPGFQYNAAQGGYVPQTTTAPMRTIGDQRLGVVDLNQPLAPIPIDGQLITRGSLHAGGQGGIITASALYGFREWNPNDQADRMFLESMLNRTNLAFDRSNLDPRVLAKMRKELEKVLQSEPNSPNTPNDRRLNDPLTLRAGQSFDSPADPSMTGKPMGDQMVTRPLAGDLGTGASFRNYVASARKTSTQYTELQKRLEQYYADRGKTDADFAREFNQAMRAKAEAEKKKVAGGVKNPNQVTPNIPNTPDVPKDDLTKPRKKPVPLKVNTLAAGVKAEGLSTLLKKAEDLMKEGKFASAMDQYDAADSVAPNNPLVWLGRANAQLGAGFYGRAQAHLRQAFMTDKALLMGQYDLSAMLGEERLGKIVAELKEIANKENNPMHVFLLAYIAYNTGHERQAVAYLDLADKRADGKDLFLKMVKEHWALPDESGAKPETRPSKPEQNK